MKKLLNTLYVTTPDAYLSLDGENIVLSREKEELGRMPLHLIDSIAVFGYRGVSPALLGKCAEYGIIISFLSPSGKFLSRSVGKINGNVVLRRAQYRLADDTEKSLDVAKTMIAAKLKNSAAVLRRVESDHEMRINTEKIQTVVEAIRRGSWNAYQAESHDSLRGIEGECASAYFDVFDELILQQKNLFVFNQRNRRPPLDPVNAMLSFGYSLMTSMCSSASEMVGLDSYVGFFHTDRPGRCSLALDIMEEFRAPFVDRFVLTLINKRMIDGDAFVKKEDGAVLLNDDGRKIFLTQWQKKKADIILHPFLNEKVQWGMIPYVQTMLLAKYIRGDLDAYPPFLWK